MILETAVRDDKVRQDFDSELLKSVDSHSQLVKGSTLLSNSGSKDCVNLPSPTAVSRMIVLIGFMGSGKSTVAKVLSQQLGVALVEMDELVYQKTGTQNMHEVFAKGGERLLRETEIAIAKEYAAKENVVISTGGGVVLNKIVLDCFKETGGKVIFLNASFEQIVKRLEKDNSRPLFKDLMQAKKMYDFRLPLYLSYANEVIDVDSRSPQEIALHIQGMANGF